MRGLEEKRFFELHQKYEEDDGRSEGKSKS